MRNAQAVIYPLDQLLCLEKCQQFSIYMQNALAQASTCGVFRKVSEVINLVSNFSISHQSLHTLSQKVGQAINQAQSEGLEQESTEDLNQAVIGTCESNHRLYTYRMKKQGKYWSRSGALSMAKLLSAQRNNEMAKYTLLAPLPAIDEVVLPRDFMRHLFKSHLPEYRDRYQGHVPNLQLNTRFNRTYCR